MPKHSRKRSDRKRRLTPLVAVLLFLLVGAGTLSAWWVLAHPAAETGSRILWMGSMDAEEARVALDEEVEKSRITVSLSPVPALDSETGDLRVNFIVAPGNNGFAERLEVEQDGQLIYASGIVQPGYQIEWAHAPQAHAGPATATVYAVDDRGTDHGNPVSAEVSVVESGVINGTERFKEVSGSWARRGF